MTQPANWSLYCTVGDSLTGVVDTSVCIDLDRDGFEFGGLPARRPVFMRYIGDTLRLVANTHYQVEYLTGSAFEAGELDSLRMTSFIELAYDAAGVSRDSRIRFGSYDSFGSGGGATCLITESMGDPRVSSYVIESDAYSLDFAPNRFSYDDDVPLLLSVATESRAPNVPMRISRTTAARIEAIPQGFDRRLMLYDRQGTAIPSQNQLDTGYLEFSGSVRRDLPLTVLLNDQSDLAIQPFVEVLARDANSSQPLPFTFEYQFDLCLPFAAVDRPISAGNGLRFKGGQPQFGGANACIQLRSGAKLELAANERLWYGTMGGGMLAINPGASLKVEEDADFLFDGTLLINPYGDGDYSIDIAHGSSFRFSESASVRGARGVLPKGQVKVNVSGGSFDMSALTNYEQDFFEVVLQPSVSPSASEFVGVHYDPSSGELALYSLSGQALQVEATLFDALGRTLARRMLQLQESTPAWITSDLLTRNGLRLLHLRDRDGRTQRIRLR